MKTIIIMMAASLAVMSCKSSQPLDTADESSVKNPSIKMVCSAPAPVQDIWKLEPMLTKKGLIQSQMTQDEKERVIRNYIAKKNEQYKNCKEGKKS